MKKFSLSAAALAMASIFLGGSVLAQSPWAANKGNTRGYQLMTPAERTEHQTKMRSFKTFDECKAYQEEHHQQMEARAKEKGVTLPAMPARNAGCENMKARGYLK